MVDGPILGFTQLSQDTYITGRGLSLPFPCPDAPTPRWIWIYLDPRKYSTTWYNRCAANNRETYMCSKARKMINQYPSLDPSLQNLPVWRLFRCLSLSAKSAKQYGFIQGMKHSRNNLLIYPLVLYPLVLYPLVN